MDYIRLTDPVTAAKAATTPGFKTTAFNQSAVHASSVNSKRKPFDDPRVRRAMHLALDRAVLIETVKDVSPMQVGGFIYPFSEFATSKDQLLSRLGYQDDTGPWTMKGTAYDTGLSLLPGPLVPRCANFSRTLRPRNSWSCRGVAARP